MNKKDLLKELEKYKYIAQSYKQVAEHYSALTPPDNGEFARDILKTVSNNIKEKKYKPVNYHMVQIQRCSEKQAKIWIEDLEEDWMFDEEMDNN